MAKTVLIVDDNAFVRHALCDLFKREPTLRYAEQQRMEKRQLRRLGNCTLI